MVPTFTMESIDEGGARLDPDSIATPTPQFFDVASPPDRQTGFGVGPHRTSGTGHALHTGPYPSGLSRLWTYGASDSGSSRTPSHQCLPDPSRLTVPTRPVRCQGCSHHRVRSHVPSGRTGGLLRRSPLRTARAAFTASSSSKPRGRLRCVVLFLTVARFPSCAAVKIRCRSRRTLSSWCRQSTASQERAASSGPFTIWCLTCPSVPALRVRFASQAHLSTSAPLSRPGHRARYPASYPATTAWRSHSRLCWFPVGFRPPAFASWTSCSRQRIPLSSQSAYRPATRAARTLSGFPCSARMRCDRVGCLLYPGAAVSSRPAQPLRSAPAASQRPALYPAETSHRRSC